MSQFYIPSTSQSAASTPAYSYHNSNAVSSTSSINNYDDDDDDDNLPYPADLPRNDFLTPSFDPQTYLSSLRNRHQTLEDLRSDLRARSQLLSKELLDLVNGNYEEFLSLGGDLKGGEEKVEGVRVGVLGYQRQVEGIRKAVVERELEVEGLLRERRGVRRDIGLGRRLLEIEEGLVELERQLRVEGHEDGLEEDEDEYSDDFDDANGGGLASMPHSIRRIQRITQQYVVVAQQVKGLPLEHPFVQTLQLRVGRSRKTLLIDLAAALRQAKTAREPEVTLTVLRLYADLGAEGESLKVLKGG